MAVAEAAKISVFDSSSALTSVGRMLVKLRNVNSSVAWSVKAATNSDAIGGITSTRKNARRTQKRMSSMG